MEVHQSIIYWHLSLIYVFSSRPELTQFSNNGAEEKSQPFKNWRATFTLFLSTCGLMGYKSQFIESSWQFIKNTTNSLL
jgi:hypothetical protein